MKFICLVYNEEKKLEAMPEGELAALVEECGAWVQELQKSGHHVSSMGLQSSGTATTLRNRSGTLSVTDGPFAETKEQLGGFTILNARDLDKALQLASKLPAVHFGSSQEEQS